MPFVEGGPPMWIWERTEEFLKPDVVPVTNPEGEYRLRTARGLRYGDCTIAVPYPRRNQDISGSHCRVEVIGCCDEIEPTIWRMERWTIFGFT